ncbi:MAG: outer membrane lipoprotein-sorting protein [bacterium]|nr:outer membrane lipoprotein-sorting protein [bacterium]
MKRLLLILVVVGLLVIGCDSGSDTSSPTSSRKTEGALPIYRIGDTWTQKGVSEGFEYTATMQVIGEDTVDGMDCYVLEMASEPAVSDTSSNPILMVDKATVDKVKMQFTDETVDASIEVETKFFYTRSQSPSPYEVGKTWETTVATFTITKHIMTNRPSTAETEFEENTFSYKIEGKEMVTVPAGTFECFKLVQYSEDGFPSKVAWQSDETKLVNVKVYDYNNAESIELISYAVSD